MFKLHTYLQRYAQQQQIKLLRSVLKHTAWFKEFSYTLKTPTGGIAWKSSPPSHTVATGLVTQTLLLTKEARPWSQHALVVSYADTSRQQCGVGMTSSEPNINLSKAANNRPHYSFQPCFSTSSWTFSWFFFFDLQQHRSSWVFHFPPAPHIHQGSSPVFHCTQLMRTYRVPALHTWNSLPDSAPPPYIWVTPTFVKSTARNQISSSKYVNNEKDVLNCPAGYPTEGLFKRAPL